jgi:membrane-associated protease RseP (regulator of RpoE activity)
MSEEANSPGEPLARLVPEAPHEAAPTAELLIAELAPAPPVMLDELHLGRPRFRRRVVLPLALFLATCATTFVAGVYGWTPGFIDESFGERLQQFWPRGIEYMVAVIAVLLAHEMGHFLMTVRYHIPASYPIFLPMPLVTLTGTMGAVISMDGLRADRRQIFDIGLAGPLAGLLLAVPLLCIGLRTAERGDSHVAPPRFAVAGDASQPSHYGQPLLEKLVRPYLRPDLPENATFQFNALYMAGWVGMLITGLNMLPVSQLDGGHIVYALLGRRGRWVGRLFLFSAITYVIFSGNYGWVIMIVLVTLLGADHPPTSNDRVRIGPWRWLIGLASLAIPILCFMPVPFSPD